MEPILIEYQNPTWFLVIQSFGSVLGIVIVAIITWKITDKTIRSNLNLAIKEDLLARDRAVWKIKFELFVRLLNCFPGNITKIEGEDLTLNTEDILKELHKIRALCKSIFNDDNIPVALAASRKLLALDLKEASIDDRFDKIIDAINFALGSMKAELNIE